MIRRTRFMFVAAAVSSGLLAVSGCGGNDSSVADELAKQREIAAARKQGERDATQTAKIKQLQKQLKKNEKGGKVTVVESTSASVPATEYVDSSGDDWTGGSGYTAILASLGSESEARSFQAEARSAGLDAGVLHSSDYGSLRPGYWVVFSGNYSSSDGAAARASYAESLGYTSAYPRFVSP